MDIKKIYLYKYIYMYVCMYTLYKYIYMDIYTYIIYIYIIYIYMQIYQELSGPGNVYSSILLLWRRVLKLPQGTVIAP